jgi:pSer/pThr/pTyr-binding forkhead associated (FHA) protein
MIGLANDELLVTDLNSTNGTYIDDERVSRGTILPVGSALRLGQVSMKHMILTRAEAEWRSSLNGAADHGGLRAGRVAATR